MIQKNFHIQRGDDVQTPPKNDVFQTFNMQSKWGALELLVLADGHTSQPDKNELTAFSVQKALAHFRILAKEAKSLEDTLNHTLQKVHEELQDEHKRRPDLDAQSAELAIAVVSGEKVHIAITGSLAAFHIKSGTVDIVAGLKAKAGSFGGDGNFKGELVGPISLARGENLVIASDGVHGGSPSGWQTIRKEELVEALKNEKDLKRAAKRLVSYPLGRNIDEDISVAIIRNPQKEKAGMSPLLLPAILGLGILAFFAYRSLAPAAPEEDSLEVIDSSGPDYSIDPIASSNAAEANASASGATYDLATGEDRLSVLVEETSLYLSPGTTLRVTDEERFLVEVEKLGSWIILMHGDPKELFTIRFGEYRLDLEPPQAGSIGVLSENSVVYFYCFSGNCSIHEPGGPQILAAEFKAVLIGENMMFEPILPGEIADLEQECACSLGR